MYLQKLIHWRKINKISKGLTFYDIFPVKKQIQMFVFRKNDENKGQFYTNWLASFFWKLPRKPKSKVELKKGWRNLTRDSNLDKY